MGLFLTGVYMHFSNIRIIIVFFLFLVLFSSCTVVKHEEQSNGNGGEVTFYFEDESFDAASYVEENWDNRVLPEIKDRAIELDAIVQGLRDNKDNTCRKYGIRKEETSPYSFMIKGHFSIREVNRASSAGLLLLDLPDVSGKGYCAVQIGPVIKKSMIRDSLDFIQFGDFSNQIEFANISRELNFYVRDNIVNVLDDSWSSGMKVNLYGAFTMNNDGGVLITPVILELVNGDNNE